jgi:cell division protein FtsZ
MLRQLYNSGTAIMGSSVSSGENRAKEAIIAALVLLY